MNGDAVPPRIIPSPDPSELTLQVMHRELTLQRDIVTERITTVARTIETRLDSMDRAAEVFADNLNRVPTVLDREISKIAVLTDEKFNSSAAARLALSEVMNTRFTERDVRAAATESANNIAINAALASLKEIIANQNSSNAVASAKSEASTSKQLDNIQMQIADIKGRMDRGEGNKEQNKDTTATMLAIGALLVSVLVGGFSIFGPRINTALQYPATTNQPPR